MGQRMLLRREICVRTLYDAAFMILFSHMVKGGLDMSIFYEDEIRKVKAKASPSDLKEIYAQDPRANGKLQSRNRQVMLDPSSRQDDSRKRRQ
jgi:hypothetical protein